MALGWIMGACGLLIIAYVVLCCRRWSQKKLPPGPKPWPIIGNLHLLGRLPHQKLAHLAGKYGPIFFLRLGSRPTIVVSSPALAKDVLHTQDKTFAFRPYLLAVNRVLYPSSLIFLQYGQQWKALRRLCTVQLFNPKRLQQTEQMRLEEILHMLQAIERQSQGGKHPVNLGECMSFVSGNIICRQLFSRTMMESEMGGFSLREIVHEIAVLFGTPVVGDFIPYLGWLDRKIKRRMDAVHKLSENFLSKVIADRLELRRGQNREDLDFLDVLLSMKEQAEIQEEDVKSILLDLMGAGIESTSDTMEWIFAELLRNPPILERLRDEIDCLGKGEESKLVEESDVPKLIYMQAVLKEAFRLHPVVPMLIPHMSSQACKIGGYEIGEKTRVLVNVWGMGRSKDVWGESFEEFHPERFLKDDDINDDDVKLRQQWGVLPFGGGRRVCVGMALAMSIIQLMVANVVKCLDMEIVNVDGEGKINMDELHGITARKAHPLIVLPRLRLPLPML